MREKEQRMVRPPEVRLTLWICDRCKVERFDRPAGARWDGKKVSRWCVPCNKGAHEHP